MATIDVSAPEALASQLKWLLECGKRYWPRRATALAELPMPIVNWQAGETNILITLPAWAADLGVGKPASLLVNSAAVASGGGDSFARCNWFAAAFFHLTGASELSGQADERLFDHAWVNRIFLLLRRLAARAASASETELFGTLPAADFHLTHDVDAVRKTIEIRFKQTAFNLFNTGRSTLKGDWTRATERFGQAVRFLATTPSYWNFAQVRRLEEERSLRSTFNFYGGAAGLRRGSLRKMLLDPAYDVNSSAMRQEIKALHDGGWRIGLHPSFDAWMDVDAVRRERAAVEAASGVAITECRQHWLRFDWIKSWQIQEQAGMTLDTTLGFNHRPGLRNGAALRFHPWNSASQSPLAVAALPMLLMDSHFYDYNPMTAEERRAACAQWIGEVRTVGGEASVNWHVHTMAADYGWADGYTDLLDFLAG